MQGWVSAQCLGPLCSLLIDLTGWLVDHQHRGTAVKAYKIGRQELSGIASFTPDNLLVWDRRLIARKYDGSQPHAPAPPRVTQQIGQPVVRLPQQ